MAFVFDRPSAFKRPRLLIVGCGDVGLRVAALLRGRWRLLALSSSRERVAELRDAGITPLPGNLDEATTLARLADLADALLYLAPPAPHGSTDRRIAELLHAMARGGRLRRIVYVSTSGVYGDCAGARIAETRRPAPATERAQRRLDAEQRLRFHGRAFGVRVTLLRVPGIYGRRDGGPFERVARAAPLPAPADAVYTGHIHADDLARACVAALHRGRAQRVIHVSDDSEIGLGAYFDMAAELSGQPRLGRVAAVGAGDAADAAEAAEAADAAEAARRADVPSPSSLAPSTLPSESRRLLNVRLKKELRLRLRYPTVAEGLGALALQRLRLPNGGWPRQ